MFYRLISKQFYSFITVLKCTGAGDYDGGRYKPLEGPATLVVPPPRDCLHGVRNISSKLYTQGADPPLFLYALRRQVKII